MPRASFTLQGFGLGVLVGAAFIWIFKPTHEPAFIPVVDTTGHFIYESDGRGDLKEVVRHIDSTANPSKRWELMNDWEPTVLNTDNGDIIFIPDVKMPAGGGLSVVYKFYTLVNGELIRTPMKDE